jgi:hypothetical protein
VCVSVHLIENSQFHVSMFESLSFGFYDLPLCETYAGKDRLARNIVEPGQAFGLLCPVELTEHLPLSEHRVSPNRITPAAKRGDRITYARPVDTHGEAPAAEALVSSVRCDVTARERLDLVPPATRHQQRIAWRQLHDETRGGFGL